jgi:hypothetical protein
VLNSPGCVARLLKCLEVLVTGLKVAAIAWLYSPRIPWLFIDVEVIGNAKQTR